jgi:hypothetical protein
METSPRPALAPRLLYYWARMYAGQLDRGEDYNGLCRAVSIVWLDGRAPPVPLGGSHANFRQLALLINIALTPAEWLRATWVTCPRIYAPL